MSALNQGGFVETVNSADRNYGQLCASLSHLRLAMIRNAYVGRGKPSGGEGTLSPILIPSPPTGDFAPCVDSGSLGQYRLCSNWGTPERPA